MSDERRCYDVKEIRTDGIVTLFDANSLHCEATFTIISKPVFLEAYFPDITPAEVAQYIAEAEANGTPINYNEADPYGCASFQLYLMDKPYCDEVVTTPIRGGDCCDPASLVRCNNTMPIFYSAHFMLRYCGPVGLPIPKVIIRPQHMVGTHPGIVSEMLSHVAISPECECTPCDEGGV